MTVGFVDQHGTRVCLVHMFIVPSGKIGASGLPDPKEIVDNTHIYRLYEPRKKD